MILKNYIKSNINFLRNSKKGRVGCVKPSLFIILLLSQQAYAQAVETDGMSKKVKNFASQLFVAKPKVDFTEINVQQLSNFPIDISASAESDFNNIIAQENMLNDGIISNESTLDLNRAIYIALQRRPEITQIIATVSEKDSNIAVAQAAYFPQISGGFSLGDLTKSQDRGAQVYSLNATQMLYDFGQIKASVTTEKINLFISQIQTLDKIDSVAYDVVDSILNINRYKNMVNIAIRQSNGISKIEDIAKLRARAGISSQADSIQAESNFEAAQASLIEQENYLQQYEQKLRTYLGFNVKNIDFKISDDLVMESHLYEKINYETIPSMMEAAAKVELSKLMKTRVKLSNYPTVNLKGTLSQAVNGVNPNNNKDNGTDSSLTVEVSMPIYEGGARSAKAKSAGYAEDASKAQVNAVYLNIVEQVRVLQEQVDHTQKQIQILVKRRDTAMRTKELYQEQYKLGTRSIVDLLSAEQAIHSAAQEIETAKYRIYSAIVQYIRYTGQTRNVYGLNNISIQGFKIQP
jgi:outer membrane protein, adhesin transport system